DAVRGEVDDVGAVGGGDLLQIALRLTLGRRHGTSELLREAGDPAAERGPGDDVLAHEARYLVAQPADATLRALERQAGLTRDEVGEPRGLAEVGAARAAPALTQLGSQRRLAGDHLVARGAARPERLTHPAGIARVAHQQQPQQATAGAAPGRTLEPRHPERREERVVGGGQTRVQARVEPGMARSPSRRGDRDHLVRNARRDVVLEDPLPEDAPLEAAARPPE